MPLETFQLGLDGILNPASSSLTIGEARTVGMKTAFLSHSHKDKNLVDGLLHILSLSGWNVYVDWKDTDLPTSPTRETAAKIQQRISGTNYFLLLATPNSLSSLWCPWELGYADGIKPDTIYVIPTRNGENVSGNEYIELYRRIDRRTDGTLEFYSPASMIGTPLRSI
jgi:hypothetical protein